MGARKFSFFESFDKIASKLSDEDRLALFDAMRDFAFRGVVPDFDGTLDLIWDAIEPNITSSIKAQENGRKGGRGNASKDVAKADGKPSSKAPLKPTSKAPLKTTGKKQGFKPGVSTDMDMDREEEVSFFEKKPSSDHASDGAAAAKAAPASARCPRDGAKLWRNTQTGRWHCPECMESFDPGGVL